MERIVERKESMSQNGRLRLLMQDDGDIIVTCLEDLDAAGSSIASVEICTPYAGRGGSRFTWLALKKLMAAMAKDNADSDQQNRAGEFAGAECLAPGLAVKPGDCEITKCVRAALYATDLNPTEDDVIGLVVSIKEDVVGPLEAELKHLRPRVFPVIPTRGVQPHPMTIPWAVAELAYSVYAAKYGCQQSLERLADRGGFHASELDEYLPDWRKLTAQDAASGAEEENDG